MRRNKAKIERPKIERGEHIGKPVDQPPKGETDHFEFCPGCGRWIDCRDWADVFDHAGPLPHTGGLKNSRTDFAGSADTALSRRSKTRSNRPA
jgi:hypothetical protein